MNKLYSWNAAQCCAHTRIFYIYKSYFFIRRLSSGTTLGTGKESDEVTMAKAPVHVELIAAQLRRRDSVVAGFTRVLSDCKCNENRTSLYTSRTAPVGGAFKYASILPL